MQRKASKRSVLPGWNDSREPLTQILLFTLLDIPGLVKGIPCHHSLMYLAFDIWNSKCCSCESTLRVAAVTLLLHGAWNLLFLQFHLVLIVAQTLHTTPLIIPLCSFHFYTQALVEMGQLGQSMGMRCFVKDSVQSISFTLGIPTEFTF